jgi:putative tricarboxylic transport membrane protein
MSGSRQVRGAPAGELTAYALLTVVGGVVLATSFGYTILFDDGRVAPGFLPMCAGGLLMLLAGVQFVARLRGTATPHHDPLAGVLSSDAVAEKAPAGTARDRTAEVEKDVLGRSVRDRVRNLRVVIGATVLAVVVTPLLGLLVAFGALVFFISTVVERRPLLRAAGITAVAVAVVYAVFVEFLSVPLPMGVFEEVF